MISVLTLTYKRHYLLEEAIESFLSQNFEGQSEMVIINDSGYDYEINNDKIVIINVKDRFKCIAEKLAFGFSKCKYNYIYRLDDDDDLLAPWALSTSWDDIKANPDYEIYRSDGHYFFDNNIYKGIHSSVNNGNIYTKDYISRIEIPNCSFGEDLIITFKNNARIYESTRSEKTMIYRWGMNTYHVSAMGNTGNSNINYITDRIVNRDIREKHLLWINQGIELKPHFKNNYYKLII